VEPDLLRRVAGAFPTGVTIVTAATRAGPHGCTANAFTCLSLEPPLVLVCLGRDSVTRLHLLEALAFAVNILPSSVEAQGLSRHFSGKGEGKFAQVGFRTGETGSPILDAAFAWLDCELEKTHEGGDHTIFVGRVVAADASPDDPIVFYRGNFTLLAPAIGGSPAGGYPCHAAPVD
jgi:flavin reductase (DIM6/NTAB) family NADH-FMN oxidoreductase RutF